MQAIIPANSTPSFDAESINKVCRNSNQIMVYGWEHTEYERLIIFANQKLSPAKKVFDFTLGRNDDLNRIKSLEGRVFDRISFQDLQEAEDDDSDASEQTDVAEDAETVKKMAKSALVNLVLENCKRKKEGLPIIPLLFAIDIDDNPYPLNIEAISTRVEDDFVTHSELRRVLKLCTLKEDPFIAEVAQETVVMVKLVKVSQNLFKLKERNPFWQHKDWKELWAKREATAKHLPKTHYWKSQLLDKWKQYINTQPSGEKRRKH